MVNQILLCIQEYELKADETGLNILNQTIAPGFRFLFESCKLVVWIRWRRYRNFIKENSIGCRMRSATK